MQRKQQPDSKCWKSISNLPSAVCPKQQHVIQSRFNICGSFAPRHANEPGCVSASRKTLFSNFWSHGNYCTQNSKAASSQIQHSTGNWLNTTRQHNIPAATSTKNHLRVGHRHIDVGINVQFEASFIKACQNAFRLNSQIRYNKFEILYCYAYLTPLTH